MNRRRIGMGAAAIAAVALVARRLRTRSDAGPGIDTPAGGETERNRVDRAVADAPSPDMAVADVEQPDVPGVDGSVIDVVVADVPGVDGSVSDVVTADELQTDASQTIADTALAPAPLVETDPSSHEVLGDPGWGQPDTQVPVAKATVGIPGLSATKSASAEAAPVALGPEPDSPASTASAHLPAVVLPTMPRAGSNEILDPIVAEPSGDAGDQAEAISPPGSPGQKVTAATQDQAGSHAPPDMPAFDSPLAGQAPGAAAALGTGSSPASVPVDGEPIDGYTAEPPGTKPPGTEPPKRRNRGGWRIFGSILGGLVVVAIIAASVIKLPYYRLEPGSVYDTIDRVEAPGDMVSLPDGEINFVTVSQTANITPWQWLDAQLDGSVAIRHEDLVQGDQSADELREADLRRMQISKNAAVVVALRKLGFDPVIRPIGIEVAAVFDCSAADGNLGTGDLIVGVNGTEVRDMDTLREQLTGIGIGQDAELLIERIDPNNPTQSLRTDLVGLTLGSSDDACLPDGVRGDEPRPFIGIETLAIVEEDFPIDVDVRTGRVSGPSAGLAFTLAIIDVLSEGELTNGLNIVATGTIDRDGNVGPVGGIHQKTIAAERSGADVFIVPNCCDNFVDRDTNEPLDLPTNYEEAVEHADEMLVIGVDTIDEALVAIGELGGDVERFLPS